MATLTHQNGTQTTDPASIEATLAPLSIRLNHWPVGDDPELLRLLDKPALDDAEKARVLTGLDHYFEKLAAEAGYQSRDLIVLHPNVPQLDELLKKFDRTHTHDDDEVRYIVAGSGVFGFVLPDGTQVHLRVERGEYINVPKDTEHWFYLDPNRTIKAVRYFTSMEGWVPRYTETSIAPIASKE